MEITLEQIGATLAAGKGPTGTPSTHTRAAILVAVAAGAKQADVARAFGVSRKSVSTMIQRWVENGSFEDKPRSGRPSVVSEKDRRYLEQQQLKRNPKLTYGELAKGLESPPSQATLRRILSATRNAQSGASGAGVTKSTAKAGNKTAAKAASRRKSTGSIASTISTVESTSPADGSITSGIATGITTGITGDISTPILIIDDAI